MMRVVLDGIGGAIRIGMKILVSLFWRGWNKNWGAIGDEGSKVIAGDGIVPQPKSQFTCGIGINAPPREVWPWLVQIGCQRGGWYSYDLLDNGGVASADRILPEFQQLAVGDPVYATRDGKLSFPVVEILPEKALVLGGTIDTKTGKGAVYREADMQAYFSGGMAFAVEEQADGTTRLLFRSRQDWNEGNLNNLLYGRFLEPIAYEMTRKTLKTLKSRIEAGK